jgi:hypothetical protein
MEELDSTLSVLSGFQSSQQSHVSGIVRTHLLAALRDYRDLLLVGQPLPSAGPILHSQPRHSTSVSTGFLPEDDAAMLMALCSVLMYDYF